MKEVKKIMPKRKCKWCRKTIYGGKQKRYCCEKCRIKWKRKYDAKFRRKQKENLQNWVIKNREKWNALIRPHSRKYQREQIILRRKRGLCIYCGKRKKKKDYSGCAKCLIKNHIYNTKYRLQSRQSKNSSKRLTSF